MDEEEDEVFPLPPAPSDFRKASKGVFEFPPGVNLQPILVHNPMSPLSNGEEVKYHSLSFIHAQLFVYHVANYKKSIRVCLNVHFLITLLIIPNVTSNFKMACI